MKHGRFVFRFSRLARIRAIQERVARAAWSEAETAARAASASLDNLRHEIAEARRHMSAEQAAGRYTPRQVLTGDEAVGSLLRGLTVLRQRELTLREAADTRKQAWAERDREQDSLRRLRERQERRHRAQAELEAARELDEVAAGRCRKAGSGGRRGSSQGARRADDPWSNPTERVAP